MVLVVDALNRIARGCRLPKPNSWISETADDYVQIREDFLVETINNIADRVDLPFPVGAEVEITGTGAENYALPADFRRLMRDELAVYEKTTNRRAGIVIASPGQWTHLKNIGTAGVERYYRIRGYDGNYSIDFYQNPSSEVVITVAYVTNLWMADSSGAAGSMFTDAEDVLLLPRRAVELGSIYRFRKDRGLDYEDVMSEYNADVQRISVDLKGHKVLNAGTSDGMRHPMRVPVPDYIPQS